MNELQINSRNNLFQTLECLASQKEQLAYKNAVPFVHIPYELICQWDGHFIKDQNWFREIWTENQWIILNKFDDEFNQICDQIPENDFVDIPEALNNPIWIKLISKSEETLTKLNKVPNNGYKA